VFLPVRYEQVIGLFTQVAGVAQTQSFPDCVTREIRAIAFTRGFYDALADDYPVDAATIEGRKAILGLLGGDAGAFAVSDWATPVLFMRSTDGDIFQEEIKEDEMADKEPQKIDTGGGAYIGGSVNTGGGDFVARDKVVHGDEVHGDKVGGDKITVGDITGSTGVAIGRGAQATVTHGSDAEAMAKAFGELYRALDKSLAGDAQKTVAKQAIETLEQEASKGEEASEAQVSEWFNVLITMLPDIRDVVIDTFTNPIKGLSTVFRKVAQKAKERYTTSG
jgi:hypothetical protein